MALVGVEPTQRNPALTRFALFPKAFKTKKRLPLDWWKSLVFSAKVTHQSFGIVKKAAINNLN